jgi:hypothetical protein
VKVGHLTDFSRGWMARLAPSDFLTPGEDAPVNFARAGLNGS